MKQTHHRRSGLTLTELLVVVAIIVIVTSVLAPLLTSSFEGREIREAARQVNAYFQQAQARAKELGRPVGVMIRRTPAVVPPAGQPFTRDTDLDFGFQLSLAEVPPPYTGFAPDVRAVVEVSAQGFPVGRVRIVDEAAPVFVKQVLINDFVRFNYRGPQYRILGVQAASASVVDINIDLADQPLVRFAPARFAKGSWFASPMKFEVYRRPEAISSTPLELPTGAGIVMNLSGVGLDPVSAATDGQEEQQNSASPRQKYIGLTEFQRPFNDVIPRFREAVMNQPLTILFNPAGDVEAIYRVTAPVGTEGLSIWTKYPPKRPQDKIYLFVGKQGVTRWENLADGSNLWITVDPQTGLVTTAPNSLSNDAGVPNTQGNLLSVVNSRLIAATGQSMGGQ